MFELSSQLQSQTVSKKIVWKYLTGKRKVTGEITHTDIQRMSIEFWAVGVRVVLRKTANTATELAKKGLSTIISIWDIGRTIANDTIAKSIGLAVIRKSDRIYLVDSNQGGDKHTVAAYPDSISCSCMKFKCLSNRISNEAPKLRSAIAKAEVPGSQDAIALTEQYDTHSRRIVETEHIYCHHILACIREAFNSSTIQDYLFSYAKVTKKSTKPLVREYTDEEIAEAQDLFGFQVKQRVEPAKIQPPRVWGSLAIPTPQTDEEEPF